MNALAGAAVVLAGLGVAALLGILGACVSDAAPGFWDRLATGKARAVVRLDVDAPRGAIVRTLDDDRPFRVVASHDGYVDAVPAR